MKDNVLIIGACGQIGVELTTALVRQYGESHVVTADLAPAHPSRRDFHEVLDVRDRHLVEAVVRRHRIKQIYLLAAALSARGEQDPAWAWDLNMKSLLNVLSIAVAAGIQRVFWPSSIAAFGPSTPCSDTPQSTVMDPTTVYGITKLAGELWCSWYHRTHRLDVRSLRFPGLLSSSAPPGGGTTDYAIHMLHAAREGLPYECFLAPDRRLPMMYMDDAVRAVIELMNAPEDAIHERSSYNITAVSFTPDELIAAIRSYVPGFSVSYRPDFRDRIAACWPESLDDNAARSDWGWKPSFDLSRIVKMMVGGGESKSLQQDPMLFAI